MLCDRRATRWVNALCGAFALGVVGGTVFLGRDLRDESGAGLMPEAGRLQVLLDRARNAEGPDAEALYEEALRERPQSGAIRLELARLLESRGECAKATRQYAILVEPCLRTRVCTPGDADTLVRYGGLHLRRGERAEARRAFRMAAEVQSRGREPRGGWRRTSPGPEGSKDTSILRATRSSRHPH